MLKLMKEEAMTVHDGAVVVMMMMVMMMMVMVMLIMVMMMMVMVMMVVMMMMVMNILTSASLLPAAFYSYTLHFPSSTFLLLPSLLLCSS